ncbi:MAG: hypothetical protein HQL44_12200 [Alphaproteobacteria bacterium]|nr:hypothetical protein [Alphaproteobacteria bacterium]
MTEHIQISAVQPRVQYTADGSQTSFPYPFPIFEASDLEVYLDGELQGSGFGVSGAGESAGGSVTFASAPAQDAQVTLRRNVAIARVSDFQEGGALRAKVLNDELDRLTAALQQVANSLDRSLVLSPVDPSGSLTLPSLAERAGAFLGFDQDGLPTALSAAGFKGDKGDKGDQGDPGTGTGDMLAANNLSDVADAQAARANLGLEIGVDVLAPDGDGSALTGISTADQTARDQIALTNLRLLLNSSIASGALVQGYMWEFASDEWGASSSGETYIAVAGGNVANISGGTGSTIGDMTNNGGLAALFDGTTVSGHGAGAMSAGVGTGNAGKNWGTPKLVSKATIYGPNNLYVGNNDTTLVKLQGSNDGSTWIDLASGTCPASNSSVTDIIYTGAGSYSYHRCLFTPTNGGASVYVAEIVFSEIISISNGYYTGAAMTLIPGSSVSASSAPTYMDAYFLWKDDSGSAVLGTDLTVDLSRDGGTTWTAATLANLASFDGTYSIVKARANVGAQPSGTSMKCRISTLNGKSQRVGPTALYAE